jgi:hypothetical protein
MWCIMCILSNKKRVERKIETKALTIRKGLSCITKTISRHVIFKHFDVSSSYKTQKNEIYFITNVQKPLKKKKKPNKFHC